MSDETQEIQDHIEEYGSYSFLYTSVVGLEKVVIQELKAYFNRLIANQLFLATEAPTFGATYRKDQIQFHDITVAAIHKGIFKTGFKNEQGYFYDPRESDDLPTTGTVEYRSYGGEWIFDVEITVKSQTRDSVAVLADAVLLGLLDPVRYALMQRDQYPITFVPDNIISTKITSISLGGTEQAFQVVITLTNLYTSWSRAFRPDGFILNEISTDISRQV